jgi:hypothetical protein
MDGAHGVFRPLTIETHREVAAEYETKYTRARNENIERVVAF